MNQYKLNEEEIARVILLYSRISNPEKRILAQGYLIGLNALTSDAFTEHMCSDSAVNSEREQRNVAREAV